MNNAIKHGHTSQIMIRLAADQEQGALASPTMGREQKATASNAGMGRHLMATGPRVIGGALDIQGVAAGGTAITCLFRFNRKVRLRPGISFRA
jgi:nitrate/nitrite-specific signal transduction histidine kinase